MADKSSEANPVEQVTQNLRTVTQAFQAAGSSAFAGQQEIAQCAIKQAQENATKLMQTLQDMASSRDPSRIAATYSQFVHEAASTNARQLMELGQIFANASQEAWGPVVDAMTAAAGRTG